VTEPLPPPPSLRPTVSQRERQLIEELLGPVDDVDLLRAVRDGRGRDFQRLELLGDSVLDVVLTTHRWVEPECPACRRESSEGAASDRRLAQAARRAGVGEWLEWEASDHRVADLVETCVAVCRASGGWAQVCDFVGRVVHAQGEVTLQTLSVGGAKTDAGRAGRRVGSACLELAAGQRAAELWPQADEGELSTRRAGAHRASRIASVARHQRADWHGDDEAVLSQVEDAVAAELAARGADAALALALGFVPLS
jgi:dsRNA-specific ribonuclease